MELDLMPDEKVIWQGHPTWRSMLAFHLKGFGMTAVLLGLLWLLDWLGVDVSTIIFGFVLIAGVGLTILAGWIQRFFTEYAITSRRLHIRRGVLSKVESSTSVNRVQNITIRQALIDRILRCGSLEFDTASSGDDPTDEFNFRGVNDPQDLRDVIMRAIGSESAPQQQSGLA
jgi:uncharacterized membrane protein YdbT with pleckstrin-like domain